MKILLVLNSFPNLSDTFIQNQITGLLARGHEVRILAFFRSPERKIQPEVEEFGLESRVRFLGLPRNRFFRAAGAIFLLLINLPRRPGAVLRMLGFIITRPTDAAFRLPFLFFRGGDWEEPEIIHCHYGTMGVIGAGLKKLGVPGRLLTTFYGFDLSESIQKPGPRPYLDLFAEADLLIPICGPFRERLAALGCPERKLALHRIGISLDRHRWAGKTVSPGEKVFLLTVGRLVEKKGHEYAIRAVAGLIRKGKNLHYLIAGQGERENSLRLLARELGVEADISFLGPKRQDEVVELCRRAHLFILASVTAASGDQEGTPIVLMEAQASGLPVVSTRHSGIPEVVEDGKSGFLVAEKDVAGIEEKVGFLVDHPELWPEMGRAGRRMMEERYDIEKLNDELVEIYRAIRDGEGRKPRSFSGSPEGRQPGLVQR